MATAEAIEAEIEQARQTLAQRLEAKQRALEASEAAEIRQRLRRELDGIHSHIQLIEEEIGDETEYRQQVDNDTRGPHVLGVEHPDPCHAASSTPANDHDVRNLAVRSNCSDCVVHGELEWTIEGMSWLKGVLRQTFCHYTASDTVTLGDSKFELAFSPWRRIRHTREVTQMLSSLAVHRMPIESNGISCGVCNDTFRHSFFIKNSSGEFVQWGETHEEIHPHVDSDGWLFGPDTVECADKKAHAVGIFGLDYDALLRSEWVKDDALTVKVKLAVRADKGKAMKLLGAPSAIELPPPTLGGDLLEQLEQLEQLEGVDGCDGRDGAAEGSPGTDIVTLFVEGERLHAHALILCARSSVFARMLRGPMKEATRREVTIDECDVLTFRGVLQYLYTDDLERMERWVTETAATSGGGGDGGADCGGGGDGGGGEDGNGGANGGDAAAAGAADLAASGASGAAGPADSSSEQQLAAKRDVVATARLALLQRLLAMSHRYQLGRLQLWAERQLAALVSVGTVCSCLCQAHLYEATRLETVCLDFIHAHEAKVSVTRAFGALSAEWPAVMLKIVHKLAGVRASAAAAEAHGGLEAASAQGTKRKRSEG